MVADAPGNGLNGPGTVRAMAITDDRTSTSSFVAASHGEAQPFPHAVIDDFLPTGVLDQVLAGFPETDDPSAVWFGTLRLRPDQQ